MNTELLNKKFDYWQHELLDLGRRNKMINYRETKRSTLKLTEPCLTELYNRICVNEETLTFKRSVDRETDARVFSILSLLEYLDNPLPVGIGDIKTEGSVIERQRTLLNMRSKSRLAKEEQGTNILYLSFGFLEWKDGQGSNAQVIKSPLILVPASLTLKALNSPFELSKYDDDIVVNPTLRHYLKSEYAIDLPEFDSDKDSPEDFFIKMNEIASKKGWNIIKDVSLGLLSFLKITMYNDMVRNEQAIKQHPVIRAMAGDVEAVNDIPENIREQSPDSVNAMDCYQVMSADSSQQDAILYSENNISYVMQGPPGTGKSQTITNIIAQSLADGKKVLFVSEKMAALQVVYRRLQDAGLGDFCLALHSYKANKKEILQQIGANLNLKHTKVKDTALSQLTELDLVKSELNSYAGELHETDPVLGISLYEAYGKFEKLVLAAAVNFGFEAPMSVTPSRLQELLNYIREYTLALGRLGGKATDCPWKGLTVRMIGFEYTERMKSSLNDAILSLGRIFAEMAKIPEIENLPSAVCLNNIEEAVDNLKRIVKLPAVPDFWLMDYNIPQALSAAKNAETLYAEIEAAKAEIEQTFNKGIYNADYIGFTNNANAAAAELSEIGLINEAPEYFISELEALIPAFDKLKACLTEICEANGALNTLLGTSFKSNSVALAAYENIYRQLQSGRVFPSGIFAADLSDVRQSVKNAEDLSAKLAHEREKLLKDYEPEILNLDYAPILTRFKTEYTGLFKSFNKQYKDDCNSIRALSRNVIKKLEDEDAVALLNRLKDYHELVKSMSELGGLSVLADYYKGEQTNFADVNGLLDSVLELTGLCPDIRNTQLAVILSGVGTLERNSAIAAFSAQLSKLQAGIGGIREVIKNTGLLLNIDSAEFDGGKAQMIADSYINALAKLSGQKAVFAPYLQNPDTSLEQILSASEKPEGLKAKLELVEKYAPDYRATFGYLFDNGVSWKEIIELLEKTDSVRQLPMFGVLKNAAKLSDERKSAVSAISDNILSAYYSMGDGMEFIKSQFDADTAISSMPLEVLYGKVTACAQNIDKINGYIDYCEAKSAAVSNGLSEFIAAIEAEDITTDTERVFLRGFYCLWIEQKCEGSDSIRRFRRNTQDERVKRFSELDDKQLLIARSRIREKLIDNLPSESRLMRATDEVAILKRELEKKRNIMPLRKLFKQIPNLLLKLKPCLMMSPLSVSYFLETDAYRFDLVIFDEASQIFPEDAIGAIFRGAQVIIAGDSKQLPPTNFFAAATGDSTEYDNEESETVYEAVCDSILEEAAAVLPNRTLLWHYRSRHEGLIAFSNREIYGGSLVTFPAGITGAKDLGVEYIYIPDGCYEGGGKNCNMKEAEKCVELVVQHINEHPERSLGIIAFSEKQQAAIEDAVTDFRERNTEYEWFFDETRDEPFFVKNLENVQGDERDTIIFSVCYGKDKNGKMFMRFGPLGHAGGERRLNVAITRAKRNIKLVGSILPSDIDLKRVTSEGVRMLRSYIEFARQGGEQLTDDVTLDSGDEFCDAVASFLTEKGYNIKRQVGSSEYKIDIAVENPEKAGEYTVAIECDGNSYVNTRTARDRDHLRRSVLSNMGWHLYRVWSVEWNRSREEQKQALIDFITKAYSEKAEEKKPEKVTEEFEEITEEVQGVKGAEIPINPYEFDYYKETDLVSLNAPKSENILDIRKNIITVVTAEQPVHKDLVYKRMAPTFTSGKVTETVKRTVDEVSAAVCFDSISTDEEGFMWLIPKGTPTVRIPPEGEEPRAVEYIATEEIAEAVCKILGMSYGITAEDLVSEVSRVYGYERKGPKIKAKTEAAVEMLKNSGRVREIDGKLTLGEQHGK